MHTKTISLTIFAAVFMLGGYWFIVRPARIRSQCEEEADLKTQRARASFQRVMESADTDKAIQSAQNLIQQNNFTDAQLYAGFYQSCLKDRGL